ncbi:interleukin-31 receptor subunit alpha-like [Xyrichtys novacula]|uniref:Interleukin-31 receptor subunit alpha-like n=1 Tax=Xyrichtys novacula TaxID=13765 RepID=A0AAV1H0P1_XYRNO|nr:interleukin-31 receptor subunit alpha-like [Xyrichtys novacula]
MSLSSRSGITEMYVHMVHLILVVLASMCKGYHENCDVVPKDIYAEVGSDIKIVCHTSCVHGHGKVFWKLNSREIDEHLSTTINSSYTVLFLRNFTEHRATLQCYSALIQEILGGTTITTYAKPSEISCMLDYNNQDVIGVPEFLICKWEHQIEPSTDTNYTVLSSFSDRSPQSEICHSREKTCTADHDKVTVILPYQTFNVTVRAKSAAFEVYSETQELDTDRIWKIIRPKVAVMTGPDHLLVNWTIMWGTKPGPFHCQVKYSQAYTERIREVTCNTAFCGTGKDLPFENLESCSVYEVTVRCALVGAPWSNWSLEKTALTRWNTADAKLQLWRNIAEPLGKGKRKVHVMWKGIPSTCQDTLNYTIQLIPSKPQTTRANHSETILCGNVTCDVNVDQDAYRIILTVAPSDAPSVQRSVYVPAVGESLPRVTGIQASTLDGVILVSWKAPVQPVSGYIIDYTHDGNQHYWRESKYTNITLIDLLDKKPYNITVTPLFNGKTGHGTQALQICSRVEANVTITNVQAYDKSATVSWDVRSQEVCRGAVVTYTVFYSKQKEPQQNVTVGSTRQYISLKDLTPDTQYHVYVQATTLSGSSNSSEWLFKTKKFDPRLLTALLVCGSITVVLLFILGVCCAVQWRKISEKPIPNPGLSSVALWSSASHQEGTFLVQPFSTPRESWCDRVYPEELEGTFTLLKDYKDKPAKDRAEEFTVPHVVPAPDEQSTYSGESVEMLHPSSPEESTELLLSDSNHSSAYRSQSSEEAPARRTSKQNEGGAVKQLENTAPPTVYVTLDMLKGKAQLKELETKT